MRKKMIVMLLALAMIMTFMPMSVFAAGEEAESIEAESIISDVVDKLKGNDASSVLSSAKSIEFGTPVEDYLSSMLDVDCFKVEVEEAGAITVQFDTAQFQEYLGREYWQVTLYDSSKTAVASTIVTGRMKTAVLPVTGAAEGTYYIRVSLPTFTSLLDITTVEYSADTYSITAFFTAGSNWELEDNDSARNAGSININTEYYASLSSSSDEDWFIFDTASQGVVSMELAGGKQASDDIYWKVNLYDDNLNELAELDVTGDEESAMSALVGLPAGSYYVCVSAGNQHSSDAYAFIVNFLEEEGWETEFNNSAETATIMFAENAVSGALGSEEDVDFYEINLSESGDYRIILNTKIQETANDYWCVTVYDSDVKSIESFYVAGNTYGEIDSLQLNAGKYYIGITSTDGVWSTDTYKLTAAYAPGDVTSVKTVAGKRKAAVSWTDAEKADAYKVYRKVKGGSYKLVKDTTSNFFIDKGLKKGKTYFYKVRSYRTVGSVTLYGNYSAAKKVKIKK